LPPGFGEAPQAPLQGAPLVQRFKLTLGPGGRLVIPAAFREAMKIREGDALLAWLEAGELHLISPKMGARQAQALARRLIPGNDSLADELIAERRRESLAEFGDG
jgi:bifunctional DNA-binding transcriptional regulator/antitoxin component of YhaV-PrlF toxin-antitoxin module